MSRWLAFAQKAEEMSGPLPANQQEPSKRGAEPTEGGFLMVSDGLMVRGVNLEQGSAEADRPFKQGESTDTTLATNLHEMSPGERPLTWTGKVVSLSDWRDLSEWDRRGSVGQSFNGETMQWEREQ